MKKAAFLKAPLYGLVAMFATTSTAFAQLISPQDCPPNTKCDANLRTVIVGITNTLLTFLGVLAVLLIIYAGFLMITAQGDQGKFQKGQKIITQAAIGIGIILIAYAIVNFVINIVFGNPV